MGNWSVGQKVLAQWNPEVFFYPATIRAIEGDKYKVQFDDGDQALVSAEQMAPLDIKVGSRVFARWKGGPSYFPGQVDQQDGAKIHVRFDDGDEEWSTISMVRVQRYDMNIPPLGGVTKDSQFGWYVSEPMRVPVLGGQWCRIVVQGYEQDAKKEDFHAAIANFLSIDESVLKAAERNIFDYYKETKEGCDEEVVEIKSPKGVWRHVALADQAFVSRRAHGDQGIYISLSCDCDWEEEHGLQIVFKNGQKVNKVGQFDGHLTNSDAYADDALEDVVYRTFED